MGAGQSEQVEWWSRRGDVDRWIVRVIAGQRCGQETSADQTPMTLSSTTQNKAMRIVQSWRILVRQSVMNLVSSQSRKVFVIGSCP